MASKKSDSPEDAADGVKILEPAQIKRAILALADKPFPFAYGLDDDKNPVLVVAKRGKSRDLAKTLKEEAGVGKPTWGMVSGAGAEMTLNVEGRVPAGMGKGVKKFCKDGGITAFKTFTLVKDGAPAAEEAEEGGPAAPSEQERTPAPVFDGSGTKGVEDCGNALDKLEDQINGVRKTARSDPGSSAKLVEYSTAYGKVADLLEQRVNKLPAVDRGPYQPLVADARAFQKEIASEVALADARNLASAAGQGMTGGTGEAAPWGAAVNQPANPSMWTDAPGGNLPLSNSPPPTADFIRLDGPLGGNWTSGGGTKSPPPAGNGNKPAPTGKPPQKPEDPNRVQVVETGDAPTWDNRTVTEEEVYGTQNWKPLTPSVSPEDVSSATSVGFAQDFVIPLKYELNLKVGPIKVKAVYLNLKGKLASKEGSAANVSSGDVTNPGVKVEIPITAWKNICGGSWSAALKGNVDITKQGGLGGAIEFTNGKGKIEAVFTFIALENGELQLPTVAVGGGFSLSNEPIRAGGVTAYFSGEAIGGLEFEPYWPWIAAQFGRVAAPAAAAAGGTITTGVAAVAGAQIIIAGGFLAIASSILVTGYIGIMDQMSLQKLSVDADQACVDFAAGFVSVWGVGSGGKGEWGKLGAGAGQNQFDDDLRTFIKGEMEKPENKGKPEDKAFIDRCVQKTKASAQAKKGVFLAMVHGMYDGMVRTGIYLQWRKANEGGVIEDKPNKWALEYAGLRNGPVTIPNHGAGLKAVEDANEQDIIKAWQREGEKG